MKISKQARRDAKQLFNACKSGGVMDEAKVRQAVQAVIAGKPRGYAAILTHFQRLVKLDLARRAAVIESATPLDAGLQASLRDNLARRYGTGLNISFTQNPALLGGVRIRVGSDVFDASVAGRLAALSDSF
jgi:F-type H+-transporting ATPase subunit delta